jgi:hypothetical protein
VESSVSPNDIGLIQKTKSKIQMDAFNYNQWEITRRVIDIDRNITVQGNKLFFKCDAL